MKSPPKIADPAALDLRETKRGHNISECSSAALYRRESSIMQEGLDRAAPDASVESLHAVEFSVRLGQVAELGQRRQLRKLAADLRSEAMRACEQPGRAHPAANSCRGGVHVP